MTRLRDPQRGCPWDREQTFATIAPYTVEEAYEVADAIDRGDRPALRDELGDLLFQVVYHAQMAKEEGSFDFQEVAEAICDKMIRRHPHVFGATEIRDARSQTEAWEKHKHRERQERSQHGALAGIPLAIPALARAAKLGKRASRAGFDWPGVEGVIAKMREEIDELEAELGERDKTRLAAEIGDMLFATVNLARHVEVDPEEALRQSNRRFENRFNYVESAVAATGTTTEKAGLDALEDYWEEAKKKGL